MKRLIFIILTVFLALFISAQNEQKMLVLLINFPQDENSSANDTYEITQQSKDFWEYRFNKKDYNIYDTVYSVADFFYDNTFGQLNIDFNLIGPITAPQPKQYYGFIQKDTIKDENQNVIEIKEVINNSSDDNSRIIELIKYALQYAVDNDLVDLSQYALENNWINHIVVLYAGKESFSAHQTGLVVDYPYNQNYPEIIDSKNDKAYYIQKYVISSEKNDNHFANIRAFCHEISHHFGLPDMYSNVHNSYYTIMGTQFGKTNNEPCGFSAFERSLLTFNFQNFYSDAPNIITLDTTSTTKQILEPLYKTNKAYRINLSDDEFVILENRSDDFKWDGILFNNQKGLFIWHIKQSRIDQQNIPYLYHNKYDNSTYVNAYTEDLGYYAINNNGEVITSGKQLFKLNNGQTVTKKITDISLDATSGNISFYFKNYLDDDDLSENFTDTLFLPNKSSFIGIEGKKYPSIITKTLNVDTWNLISLAIDTDAPITILNDNNNNNIYNNQPNDVASIKFDLNKNTWNENFLFSNDVFSKNEAILAYFFKNNEENQVNLYQRGDLFVNDNYSITINNTSNNTNENDKHSGHWAMLPNVYPATLSYNKFLSDNDGKIQGNVGYLLEDGEWKLFDCNANIDAMTGFAICIAENENNEYEQTFNFNKTQLKENNISQDLTNNQSSANKFTSLQNMIKINALYNNTVNTAYINLNSIASNDFNKQDAYCCMNNIQKSQIKPYFMINGQEISKKEIKTLPYQTMINFFATTKDYLQNTSDTCIVWIENLPDSLEVILLDTISNKQIIFQNNEKNIVRIHNIHGGNPFVFEIHNKISPNQIISNDFSVQFYPTFADDYINLTIYDDNSYSLITIVNTIGNIIQKYFLENNKQHQINIKNLAKGMYFVNISNVDGNKILKFNKI